MTCEEALRVVFPLLNCIELASCMLVCRQWREIAGDDFFWKCLCDKRWPSICKRSAPLPVSSYRELFSMFFKRRYHRIHHPKFSFADLEFYIDIWYEDRLLFSEVVPGSVLPGRIKDLPPDVYEWQRGYLCGREFKFIIPLEPKFCILRETETISLSIHVCRTDTNQFACICEKFDLDPFEYQCLAPNPLDFDPKTISRNILDIPVLVSLLYIEDLDDHFVDVSGISLEFRNLALGIDVRDKREFLSVLHMLDWD